MKLEDTRSEWLSSDYGVPQGSALRPLLYPVYVLNLKLAKLEAKFFTFADDTVLLYTGTDEINLNNQVNNEMAAFK